MGQVARERWSFLYSIIKCSFVSKMIKGIGNTMCSSPICGKVSASTTSVQSLLTAVIVKDGFRLALQLHKLLRDVSVCMHVLVCLCVGSTYLNPLKSQHHGYFLSLSPRPWFLTLEHPGKFDFQGRAVHTPQPQFLFSFTVCFHCWLKLSAASLLLHSSLEMEA